MVVDCHIVIVSIGDNLFQSRPDQDWQILGQAPLLLSWQLVLFSQPLLYCGWSQCTLCLLTMTADISWYQLQAGNNCKICLKTCCLLLNTVSLFSSPIEYLLFCLFFCLQLMIVPMDTGQLLLFYICIFFLHSKHNRLPSWQNLSWDASQVLNLFSSQHIFSLQCLDHNDPSKPSHRLTNGPEPSKTIESDGSNIKKPS